MSALVIACHGTRIAAGKAACRALVARVGRMLPEVAVSAGYVELDEPLVAEAVADALAGDADGHVVVVPLMVGTGGHVRADIPEGIAEGRQQSGGWVTYTRHLGPDDRLRAAALQRIEARLTPADGEVWAAGETAVVFLGRGTSVSDANADHVRLGRQIWEQGGFADLVCGFIQVTRPDLPAALDRAYAHGGRKIVVMPHYLFPGRLEIWAHRAVDQWLLAHPDAQVRITDVVGDCDELAEVVVDRYREAVRGRSGLLHEDETDPVYLAGLVLRDRPVLVVGAGRVAARRIGRLIEAGAQVHVVAPEADERIVALAGQGALRWSARPVDRADLDEVWYVLAATDVPEVNAEVAEWAARRRVFCVRSDDAAGGSAWTPASGRVNGLVVGVLGGRDPHRSVRARQAALAAIGASEGC